MFCWIQLWTVAGPLNDIQTAPEGTHFVILAVALGRGSLMGRKGFLLGREPKIETAIGYLISSKMWPSGPWQHAVIDGWTLM